MEIIKDKIEELMDRSGYVYKEQYEDRQLNMWLNYWRFLDEKEKEIQNLSGVSLETILYSKYYWCTRCKDRLHKLYGMEAGIDQQQYKMIEEMGQRIKDFDWSLIQEIEEGF